MAEPYADSIYLRGNFGPVRMEADAPDLVIEGEWPKDIKGVLYRNGPNPQYNPWSEHHHWFMGDGMIHAFYIEDGKVRYRNRWVRTQKFEHERNLGEAVIATDFNDILNQDPRAEGVSMNVANTNIVYHAGKLLALEEASPAVAMDPDTLETIGPWTFEDGYDGPLSAHPKFDPDTGEMISFGAMAGGPGSNEIAYVVVDKSGKMTQCETIEAPYASMIHDFLVTENYVVMPVMPGTIDFERIMEGGAFVAWDGSKKNHIGVFRRDQGPKSIKWYEGDASYVFHFLNAYEEDGKLYADVMQYDRLPLFDEDADPDASPADMDVNNQLKRWTFDLKGNQDSYTEEALDDFMGDFPRLDDRFAGKKHTRGFFCSRAEGTEGEDPFNRLIGKNFATGENDVWAPEDGTFIQEPVFVPRSADSEQGDGYIITLTYERGTNTSDLVLLDANDLSSGPIARAKLPFRVPYGFHGNWRALD